MKKTWLAKATSVALATTMLAGCGNTEEVVEPAADGGTEAEAAPVEDEEVSDITIMLMGFGAQEDGVRRVEAALNEITEAEINTHVTIKFIDPGQYGQQVNLAISGNEDVDAIMVTPIPNANFSSLTSSKSLIPLNDLMAEYGQATLDTVADVIPSTTVNGNIYALPSYRNTAMSTYIMMRKDKLEEVGMLEKAQNMTTWTEYEEIMTAVKEKTGMYGTGNNDADGTIINILGYNMGDDAFANNSSFDNLGDTSKIIATDENGKAVNYYETEYFKQMMERVKGWKEKGLIYPDSATSTETADQLMQNDVYFSATIVGETGTAEVHSAAIGKEVIATKIVGKKTDTNAATKFGWAIPTCAKEPEAAAKFLNLMFTDKRVADLLAWGVEGEDFVYKADGVAAYPEGKSADTVTYHTADFLYGNQFITAPWDGTSPTAREDAKKEIIETGYSQYLGFACDTSVIANELAAVTNVVNEFLPALACGELDEKGYNDFIAKLKSAGVDTIVAEYQTQLDAWLAQQ